MTLIADLTRARGRPFQKGVSGNPAGRPVGARNKATLRLEALLDATGEALFLKLIDRALDGDMAAMRLCLKVMFPTGRKRGVEIALPALETVGHCMQAQAMIIEATARGEITLDEAKALSELVDLQRRGLANAESDASAEVCSEGARNDGRKCAVKRAGLALDHAEEQTTHRTGMVCPQPDQPFTFLSRRNR